MSCEKRGVAARRRSYLWFRRVRSRACIAGPLAALLSGADLHFVAPFKADMFLQLLDDIGPVRLVAPAAIFAGSARSGLLNNGALLSCSVTSARKSNFGGGSLGRLPQ